MCDGEAKVTKILMVSSLIKSKSVDHAVFAVDELKKSGHKFTLSVVGGGELSCELQALVQRLGLQEYVFFKGVLPHESLEDVFAAHDIFLVCSSQEGRSTVVMEALAVGLPVVASNVKGVRELLVGSPCSYMYEYGDVSMITKSLLLANDRLQSVGKIRSSDYSKRWVDELGLTWESTSESYKKIFDG
ncbi:hypothetical protein GCM10027217_04710 [Pseudomaricurvus hydrocarbonicus]